MRARFLVLALLCLIACSADHQPGPVQPVSADLILTNARVYTLSWPDPRPDGRIAPIAPYSNGWKPDAEAVAIKDGVIAFVGSHKQAAAWRGEQTSSRNLHGATIIPGLVAYATADLDLSVDLQRMVNGGYVAVNLAGITAAQVELLDSMQRGGRLPLHVYTMPALAAGAAMPSWATPEAAPGPTSGTDSWLATTGFQLSSAGDLGSVAAVADAAMRAGFQLSISLDSTQDTAAVLDFLRRHNAGQRTGVGRPRLEHAQRLSQSALDQLGQLRLVAAVDPPLTGAPGLFARQLRSSGALLLLNSAHPQVAGSIFAELYAVITRQPEQAWSGRGWSPHQRLSMDEALRAYTRWPAFANFQEAHTGVIKVNRRADLTVMDVDPFVLGETDPEGLLAGRILMTVVGGRIGYQGL